MNELLKTFIKINRLAFMAAKRLEYAVRGFIYEKKVDYAIKNFNVAERDDVDTEFAPCVAQPDYTNKRELNQYLRDTFNEKFPETFYIACPDGLLRFQLIHISEEGIRVRRKYVVNMTNRNNKVYSYLKTFRYYDEY